MRKILLRTLAAMLSLAALPALAEGGLVQALATPAPTAAPTAAPESTPAGPEFTGGGLRLTLPEGFEILAGEELAAYEAAVQFDFPGAAQTLFAAADPKRGASLVLVAFESEASCLDAAREAAQALVGDPDAAEELQIGETPAAQFDCAVGGQRFRLRYLSDGGRILVLGASGLEGAELDAVLGTLER